MKLAFTKILVSALPAFTVATISMVVNAGRDVKRNIMTRLIAYLRLLKTKRSKKTAFNQIGYIDNKIDDIILDFDLRPYLGWMEEELELRKD